MRQRRQPEVFRSLTFSLTSRKKVRNCHKPESEIKKRTDPGYLHTGTPGKSFPGFRTEVTGQVMPGDDKEEITKAILSFADAGADLIICTGGNECGSR